MTSRPCQQLLERPRVHDPVRLDPDDGRLLAAVAQPLELSRRVGVGVDRDHAPGADGRARSSASGGSRRSGRELISTAVPVRAQASNTSAWSKRDSGRPRPTTMRPVQWPRMSVWGLSMAATMRRVIWAGLHLELGVHARHHDVEPGQQVRVLVERPVLEDVDLDAGEDAERGQLLVQRLAPPRAGGAGARRSSPWATVSRGLWSVSASTRARASAAASAISAMGLPPSDQSEWLWQSPRSSARELRGRSGRARARPRPRGERGRTGVSPARASAITRAVVSPTPGRSVRRPDAARWARTSGSTSSTVAAARRKARTL